MPELIAKTALAGRTPVIHAGTTLAEVDLGRITSVACFPGKLAAVTSALGGFPAPNTQAGDLVWTGPESGVPDRPRRHPT